MADDQAGNGFGNNIARVERNQRDQNRITPAVLEKELEDIRSRRAAMFDDVREPDPKGDHGLVGLALSGGGVRSASFNFGLLQAFIETGLIRWVDYMSTVSGGGYIGGCLSTVLHEASAKRGGTGKSPVQPAVDEIPAASSIDDTVRCQADDTSRDYSIVNSNEKRSKPTPDGASADGERNGHGLLQSVRTQQSEGSLQGSKETHAIWKSLAFPPSQGQARGSDHLDPRSELRTPFYGGGQYVRDGLQFMETLIWGAICNLSVWGSLLVFATATIALFWRFLDLPWLTKAIRHAAPLWHYAWWTDYSRPFLIPLALLLIWLVWRGRALLEQSWKPDAPSPHRSRWLFMAVVICTAIGFAVLVSNSEASNRHAPESVSPIVESGSRPLWILLFVLGALLLPYLNPLRLARSDIRPVGKFESLIMAYAGLGLLLLVPFTAVYLFAREDLSGSATAPDRQLNHVDFRWPPEFLSQLVHEDSPSTRPLTVGAAAWDAIAGNWTKYSPSFPDKLAELASAYDCAADIDEISKLTKAKGFEPNSAEGAIVLHLTAQDYVESGYRSSWYQSLDGRILYCERAIREAIGSHVARIAEDFVLADPRLSSILRERFAADGTSDEERSFFASIATLEEGSEFLSDLWPKVLATQGNLTPAEMRRLNRLILEASYPNLVRPRSQASFHMTWGQDQLIRFGFAVGGLLLFLVAGNFISLNATSMQAFYREKLKDAYFVGDTKLADLDATSVGGPYQLFCAALNFFDDLPWRVAEYSQTYTFIFSRHFCGSQSLSSHPAQPSPLNINWGLFDEGAGGTSWGGTTERCQVAVALVDNSVVDTMVSNNEVVVPNGYAPTTNYCELDVPTVAAISGAAFSPAIFRNPFMTFGTFLLNLRLGQWLPNPKLVPNDTAHQEAECSSSPSTSKASGCFAPALPIVKDFVRTFMRRRYKPEDWRYCFVSDGGHNDNLGLAPLVLRRCKLIIVSDASQDENYEFEPLLKFYRRISMRFDMDLVKWHGHLGERSKTFSLRALSPRRVTASRIRERRFAARLLDAVSGWRQTQEFTHFDADTLSTEHFIISRLVYPDDPEGALFVYLKPTFTGDEPIDLVQYRRENPTFPHDPTTDQMYTEDRVESYRRLGHHIGMRLCERIQQGLSSKRDSTLWDEEYSVAELIQRLTRKVRRAPFSDADPRIAKLISQLGGNAKQARLAREQLVKLGLRILAALCRVTSNTSMYTSAQRAQAIQGVHQIVATHLDTMNDFKKQLVQATAAAVEKDPYWEIRIWGNAIRELFTDKSRKDNAPLAAGRNGSSVPSGSEIVDELANTKPVANFPE